MTKLSLRPQSFRWLYYWVAFGLFIQLAGLCFIVDGSRYSNNVYLSFFIPALILFILKLRERITQFTWDQVCLLLLFSWMIIELYIGPDVETNTLYGFKTLFLILLYITAIASLVSQVNLLKTVLIAFVVVAGICAIGSIVFHVIDHPMSQWQKSNVRLTGWNWHGIADFNNAIVAAFYYGIALNTALFLFNSSKPRRKILRSILLLVIAACGICLFLTFSRGVWFASLTSVLLLWWLQERKVWSILFSCGVILLVLVSLLLTSASPLLHRGMSYRDVIWEHWFKLLPSFWLWGRGSGADLNLCLESHKCVNQAHNLYLQFSYEYGVIGLILLLALCIGLVLRGLRYRYHEMAALGLSLFSFALVSSLADFYDVLTRPGVYWLVFWLPVGILFGLRARQDELLIGRAESI